MTGPSFGSRVGEANCRNSWRQDSDIHCKFPEEAMLNERLGWLSSLSSFVYASVMLSL